MAKREIWDTELLVLDEKSVSKGDVRKGFQKTRLRVTSWSNGRPVLEKRIMVLDLDGKWYPYKSTGMNIDDVNLIFESRDKILNCMMSFVKKEKSDAGTNTE